MTLSDSDHTKLMHRLTGEYPAGAVKGMLKFAHAVTGTLSNSYRNASQNIRLAILQHCRVVTGLSVFADGKLRDFDASLAGDILTIGPDVVRLNRPDAAAALVKVLYHAVNQTVASDA